MCVFVGVYVCAIVRQGAGETTPQTKRKGALYAPAITSKFVVVVFVFVL